MVSPRKTTSAVGLMPEERLKMLPSSTKSCESLYSSSSKGSATVLYSRTTPTGPSIAAGKNRTRQPSLLPASTEVKQRVLSARRLRKKTYQNQLADAQQTITELANENRILRSLHKRQSSALSRYESANADLPKLLHSHAEELRVWQTKYRNMQALNKELEQKLKQKETVILSLGDQNRYYNQLNKDKNLDERQRLTEKLQALEARLQEKDNDMKLFVRKVQLESKNYKQQIQNEQKKTKDVLIKLEKARLELSGYRKLDELTEMPDKYSNLTLRRKNINSKGEECKWDELDKLPEKSDGNDYLTPEEATPQTSERSKSSNASSSNKASSNSERYNQRKTKIPTIQSQKELSAATTQHKRRMDRGDGDAPAMIDSKKTSVGGQQLPQQPLQFLQQQPNHEESKNHLIDYPDDYENDNDEEALVDEPSNPADEDVEEEEEDDYQFTDEASDDEEDDEITPHKNNESFEDDDEENEDIIAKGTKPAAALIKDEISNIRKQITDDYKEREAFLDTFCRQATSTILVDEQSKKRSGVTLTQNLPSSRKNKLLSALKAIDDSKSQD